ncbi:MAG: alpha/beta hydrolase [Eubacteriales bacterium]|nr:alpha/beta hydrolase [Eubacteriales bacterium]
MNLFLALATFILAAMVIAPVYLIIISKGQIQSFTDKNGTIIPNSITEKIKVEIGGIEQGMFLRGKNTNNPVLLFIHGGPGVPEYFLNETYPTDLENHFTVCWWEARGSGLSYSSDLDGSSLSTRQLIDDTISVTEYLNNRFGKDRVYLMGHSFGTLIGIRAAAERPDLYCAYIGMAQAVGNDLVGSASNTLTYHFMTDVFSSRNDIPSLKRLDKWSNKHEDGTVTFDQNYLGQIDDLKHKAGCGTMKSMDSVITGIFFPQMNSKCYTIQEKIDYWRGKAFMRSTTVYEEFFSADLFKESLSFKIPIYFFSGTYDYTCPYPLSLKYFKTLDASLKGFYTFNNSAHSPLWEEPDRAIKILAEDILQGTNELSDFIM